MAGRRQPIRQRSARKRNTIRCRSICAQASAGLDQPRESFWVVRPEKTADANSPEFSRTQGELHSVLAVEEGYGLWLDPAIAENAVYAEHWAGKRSVTVTVEADRIVIRRSDDE